MGKTGFMYFPSLHGYFTLFEIAHMKYAACREFCKQSHYAVLSSAQPAAAIWTYVYTVVCPNGNSNQQLCK